MTVAGWCWRSRAATLPPCAGFSTRWAPSGVRRSPIVSADAADWIADVVAERCPAAIRCADPFHVVAWAAGRSMPSAAGPGTTRGRWPAARPKWGHGLRHTPRRVPAMSGPASSRAPVMRCGRTRRPHRTPKPPSWPGSPRPTLRLSPAVAEKRRCGMCIRSRARKADGAGPVDLLGAALPRAGASSSWPPHRATPRSHQHPH